jgi:hypothetical protein
VLSDQFTLATYHAAVGGFMTGGLPIKKDPKLLGCYYEVTLDKVDERWNGGMGIGFCTKTPDEIVALYGTPAKFPRSAKSIPTSWLLGYDGNVAFVNGQARSLTAKEKIGPPWQPKSLRVGDTLGVLAHKTGFSLWVNRDPKLVFTGASMPLGQQLHALMELDGRCKAVRVVPQSKMPPLDKLKAHLGLKF